MGFISSLIDWAAADDQNFEQMYNQWKMFDAQNEEYWKRFNVQNEYNSPVEQRKRLEAAGINPNLAFGSSASSGMASSPSSPSFPSPSGNRKANINFDLWQMHLQKKQVEADIRARDANTRREDEMTEQLKMNNQILGSLLQDKIATAQGDMYVQRIEQAWKEDHLRELLDAGLTQKEVQNDLTRFQKVYFESLKTRTDQSYENLKQEYNHLKSKYGFEDWFYNQRMHPPHGGSLIDSANAVYGIFTGFLEYLFNSL